ncbi:MAG: hypothetical protein KTR20_13595 [Cellvibrionaceae bacterium]|nr:hypothetical protein [Cellvibrionaceae bacterium]
MTTLKREFSYNQTYQWTSFGLNAIRKAMQDMGFNEIVPAMLSKELEPGAFHSYAVIGDKLRPQIKEVEDKKDIETQITATGKAAYYLPVSHNFEKQQAVEFLNKVYCLAPCLRLLQKGENESKKHLNTFFQVEVEWQTQCIDEIFATAEAILTKAAAYIKNDLQSTNGLVSEVSQKNLDSITKGQLPKITFAEALEMVGADKNRRSDLSFEEDRLLSSKFDRPFSIYNYPLFLSCCNPGQAIGKCRATAKN